MTGCCDFDVEFGIVTCDNPDHCEHPSRAGDGDVWVCDVCGDREPMDLDSGRVSALAVRPRTAAAASGGSTNERNEP